MKRHFALFIALIGCIAIGAAARDASGQGAWVMLVDGKAIGDWNRIGVANWRIEDGALMADKKEGKDAAYLVTKESYKDFQIRAEFWASDDCNSGIFIRLSDPAKITATNSYEVNIFDQRPDPSYGTGAIVNFAKVDPMPKAGGKWNTFDITAKGTQLVVIMNGTKTVDINDGKFAEGPFALQYGSGVIKFRKVEVRRL